MESTNVLDIIENNLSKTNKFTELLIYFGKLHLKHCFITHFYELKHIRQLMKWIKTSYGDSIPFNNYTYKKFRVYETVFEYYEKQFRKYDIHTIDHSFSDNLLIYFNELKETTTHPVSFIPSEIMDSKTIEELVFTLPTFNIVITRLDDKYSINLQIQKPNDSGIILKTIEEIQSVITE